MRLTRLSTTCLNLGASATDPCSNTSLLDLKTCPSNEVPLKLAEPVILNPLGSMPKKYGLSANTFLFIKPNHTLLKTCCLTKKALYRLADRHPKSSSLTATRRI